jgi:hypothetical protein
VLNNDAAPLTIDYIRDTAEARWAENSACYDELAQVTWYMICEDLAKQNEWLFGTYHDE